MTTFSIIATSYLAGVASSVIIFWMITHAEEDPNQE
jgi:hypothetical protein